VQKQSWAGFSQFATSNRGHLAKVPASQQLTTPAQPPRSITNRARDAGVAFSKFVWNVQVTSLRRIT